MLAPIGNSFAALKCMAAAIMWADERTHGPPGAIVLGEPNWASGRMLSADEHDDIMHGRRRRRRRRPIVLATSWRGVRHFGRGRAGPGGRHSGRAINCVMTGNGPDPMARARPAPVGRPAAPSYRRSWRAVVPAPRRGQTARVGALATGPGPGKDKKRGRRQENNRPTALIVAHGVRLNVNFA